MERTYHHVRQSAFNQLPKLSSTCTFHLRLLGFKTAANIDLTCSVYPQRGSTSLDKDTEMKNPEESKSFTPLRLVLLLLKYLSKC